MYVSSLSNMPLMQDHRVLLSILLLTKVDFQWPVTFYIKPALTTPSVPGLVQLPFYVPSLNLLLWIGHLSF